MSILIKGMEIPTNEPMLIKINPDGSINTTAKNGYKKYKAIPVTAHGRLIDADALIKELSIDDADEPNGATLLMAVFLEVLKAAPTIIPADEEAE